MEKDKRFLLFVTQAYYPAGGMNDLEASFDTLEELKAHLKLPNNYEYIEAYDRIEGIEVEI